MSDAPPPPADPGGLQFDRAESREPAAGGLSCAACKRPVSGEYYTAGDKAVCADCRGAILASLQGGSGLARFVKATFFGLLAAALGAGIYYGVRAATGYEIGLVAIIVGFMVGAAVKKGSEGRGGWRYQLLAVFLTYCAIVATYVPAIIEGIRQHPAVQESLSSPLGLIKLAGYILAIPFLAGFENIIGLLIIGFALYEAWVINRKMRVSLAGPFRAPGSPAAS